MASPKSDSSNLVVHSQKESTEEPQEEINIAHSSFLQRHQLVGGEESVKVSSRESWPSLTEGSTGMIGKKTKDYVSPTFVANDPQKQPGRKEDNLRFPWAAKMNPALRNLYRATEPEYLEDGTPKVIVPTHVLLQGLENQSEYILGQFYRCAPPPGGMIYAVFNKLWGRSCRITIKKLGDSSYLFHIPDEASRKWVLQRGLWHIDDC
ncbi:hypothetical protein Rs2_48432 [Raphanus sativus]|nr:hypothetical protein Rs2_48432 [Raphanus sativus]